MNCILLFNSFDTENTDYGIITFLFNNEFFFADVLTLMSSIYIIYLIWLAYVLYLIKFRNFIRCEVVLSYRKHNIFVYSWGSVFHILWVTVLHSTYLKNKNITFQCWISTKECFNFFYFMGTACSIDIWTLYFFTYCSYLELV